MATASDSPSAPVQSVNPVLDHHSLKEISDQKHVLAPEIFLVAASFLAKDGEPEGSENDGVTEKRVWNKPAIGVTPEDGAVMGGASWPALSKSARAFTKASSTDSLKEVSHGSITLSKGMSVDSWSSQEVSATNSPSNHEYPSRRLSPELGGGSPSHRNITSNDSFSQTPNSHSSVSLLNPVKSSSTSGPRERDAGHRVESHSGHDLHHPRPPFRRNNGEPRFQGNGFSNYRHGSKRYQERWSNNHQSFGNRVNLASQQRVVSRPFVRGPISNAPFIPLPPPVAMQPYVPPVFYNDTSSLMYYASGPHPGSLGHMPMVPFAPMFYPISDPHLTSKIVSQIDYYFSDDNLVKDTFLRNKMDVDGWVPINLIANFKKIRELTDNVQLILDALQASNVVEIQGEKVRRKGNWRKWIMSTILPTGSSPHSLNISGLHIHDEKTET